MAQHHSRSACLLTTLLLLALCVPAAAQSTDPQVSTQALFETGEFDAVLARVAEGGDAAPEDIFIAGMTLQKREDLEGASAQMHRLEAGADEAARAAHAEPARGIGADVRRCGCGEDRGEADGVRGRAAARGATCALGTHSRRQAECGGAQSASPSRSGARGGEAGAELGRRGRRRQRVDVHVAAEFEAGELAGARLQFEVPMEAFAGHAVQPQVEGRPAEAACLSPRQWARGPRARGFA